MAGKKIKREFCKEDGYSSKALLIGAHNHLLSAHVLFEYSPSCYFSGGYLAHLGIELILKAYLLHLSGCFPNVHDLEGLKSAIEKAGGDLSLPEEHLRTLITTDQFYMKDFKEYETVTISLPNS